MKCGIPRAGIETANDPLPYPNQIPLSEQLVPQNAVNRSTKPTQNPELRPR